MAQAENTTEDIANYNIRLNINSNNDNICREVTELGNEIIEVPMEVEVLDKAVEELQMDGYVHVPISELSTYGIVGNELYQLIEVIKNPGGEGIYRVSFPKGVGGALTKFKNENAFFGAITKDHIIEAQARLTQIQFNPEHLFMAVALMDINIKLVEIMEVQKKMLEFMYAKEESKIYGSYNMLNEAIGKYRYNWDQEKYIDQSIGLVRSVKNEMYTVIELYKKQIMNIMVNSKGPHLLRDAGHKVREMSRMIKSYHDAYYLLVYSTFFETLLLKNYSSINLENIKYTIETHEQEYNLTYDLSYKWAEKYITSAINYLAGPILYGVDKTYEKILKRIPFDFDKYYGAESELYRSAEEQLEVMNEYKETGMSLFAEEIAKLDIIHNKELEILIDDNYVHFLIESVE